MASPNVGAATSKTTLCCEKKMEGRVLVNKHLTEMINRSSSPTQNLLKSRRCFCHVPVEFLVASPNVGAATSKTTLCCEKKWRAECLYNYLDTVDG